MIKKLMTVFVLCAGLSGALHAAMKGSCESEAPEIDFKGAGATRTVTLVNEYYPDEGSYDTTSGIGTYYFKATLKRSYAYTVWTEGVTTNDEVMVDCYSADPKDDDKDGSSAEFTELEEMAGNQRFVLRSDDWYIDDEDPSESDPKSWTYYFQIRGPVGTSVTINFQSGVVIPPGREDNPKSISPAERKTTLQNLPLQLDGEYYFRVRLQANRMYWFGTQGGTTNMVLNMVIAGEDNEEEGSSSQFDFFEDPKYADDENNSGFYVVPSETDYYIITIDGSAENESEPFDFSYQLIPARGVAAHPVTELNESNGYAADFKPGYMANVGLGFYDGIIDESLFKFTAVKDGRYLLQTEGAETNLLMRVYDAKGTMLYENAGDGETDNVRCAFQAKAAGVYYVGVCQNIPNEIEHEPAGTSARITLADAATVEGSPDAFDPADDVSAGATPLSPMPGKSTDLPEALDAVGNGPHQLGTTDWTDVFMIAGRKGLVYALRTSLDGVAKTTNTLKAEVYYLSGTTEKAVTIYGDVNAGSEQPLMFAADANTTYYVRLSVAQGQGLDYPAYRVHAMAYSSTGDALGILTVKTHGTDAGTFSLGSEKVKYPGGNSVLVGGVQTVKFGAVAGFSVPASQTVSVVPGTTPTVVEAYYSDTADPKDDTWKGAVAWSLKNVETSFARTLWSSDPEDSFSFATKDGQYYDFALRGVEGDAVFSITNATGDAAHPDGVFARDVTSLSQIQLPAAKTKYYLTVTHGTSEKVGGGYTVAGFLADVGAIKFAKTTVSTKENAPSVVVTVNRTAKDGRVRVKYGTVAGTAKPGEDYVAQNGILEWAANDNKAKTITIKLIPDLVPVYEGNKTFAVQLKPVEDEERGADEYPAAIAGGDVCTITLTEVSKAGTTVASSYAAKAPKLATVKTEVVPLETGTFFGVLSEDGCALTNGLPKRASITFTASAANPSALSAKVALAGKTYTFSAKGWDEADGETCVKTFELAQKVNGVTYTNTLMVSVAQGGTDVAEDWLRAGGEVELRMNVPDANGKGVQEEIVYCGDLHRQNAKIQDYLVAVTNFTGYYTMALVPDAWVGSGVPAGNGYLTLTIDNKGTVKAAGQLADGSTKVSLSVAACALHPDESSANGYALHVPLFFAKAPLCFGGELRLFAQEDGRVVIDSSRVLAWYNDNKALTYDNEEGYQIELTPVGGWYDQIVNLQAYYLKYVLEVETADVFEFPTEVLPSGYEFSMDANPSGTPVEVQGDALSVAKRQVVKNGKLTDLVNSLNVCNVQVKFARATGLVTGSFSVWSENEEGTAQKEISGLKHSGVLLLARDDMAPISDEIVSAGFFTRSMTVVDENPETGRKTNRKWTFSAPFNILGIDQGDLDWWADDWGTQVP